MKQALDYVQLDKKKKKKDKIKFFCFRDNSYFDNFEYGNFWIWSNVF